MYPRLSLTSEKSDPVRWKPLSNTQCSKSLPRESPYDQVHTLWRLQSLRCRLRTKLNVKLKTNRNNFVSMMQESLLLTAFWNWSKFLRETVNSLLCLPRLHGSFFIFKVVLSCPRPVFNPRPTPQHSA